MKNKKMLIALGAFVLVIAVLAAVFFFNKPQSQAGVKNITVTVIHKDGAQKVFECQSDAEFLAAVLVEEKIVTPNEDYLENGLYFQEADGEYADWSVDEGWWKILVNDVEANFGASDIPLADGDSYAIVYTMGMSVE